MNTLETINRVILCATKNCLLDGADFDAEMRWLYQFPHRLIPGDPENKTLYMTRFEIGTLIDTTVYVHRFAKGDDDRELHNHPWKKSQSLILYGGYVEWREANLGYLWRTEFRPGMVNTIDDKTFHKVELLDGKPCWTLFFAGERFQDWGFKEHGTDNFIPKDRFFELKGFPKP